MECIIIFSESLIERSRKKNEMAFFFSPKERIFPTNRRRRSFSYARTHTHTHCDGCETKEKTAPVKSDLSTTFKRDQRLDFEEAQARVSHTRQIKREREGAPHRRRRVERERET
jgi:hypothetical protein